MVGYVGSDLASANSIVSDTLGPGGQHYQPKSRALYNVGYGFKGTSNRPVGPNALFRRGRPPAQLHRTGRSRGLLSTRFFDVTAVNCNASTGRVLTLPDNAQSDLLGSVATTTS